MSPVATKRAAVLEGLRLRVGELPTGPGVYLFKDAAGVVLYVGKAKNLRSRVASYFQPSADLLATRGPEIRRLIERLVAGVDTLECDSEVDALLHESRLIKDIQPRFNERQKDDKSFPYLQITTDEDFPRVSITRRPRTKGVSLFGPFVSVGDLRAAVPLLQRVFKFRTCKLPIAAAPPEPDAPGGERFRPCILYNIRQCSAPCAGRVGRRDYAGQIADLRKFLASKGSQLRRSLKRKMAAAASRLDYERAAMLRDELRALEGLQKRGLVREHVQPEVFYVDPAEGLAKLAAVLGMPAAPRTIEGIDIAHLGGTDTCGAMVCFIDGRPFKSGYRRYRIRTASGGDDFAAIREVVWRRYKRAGMNAELFPDVILIDGGREQLSAAAGAFDGLELRPPMLVSLAKKTETVFVQGRRGSLGLARNNAALRLLQSVRDEAHRFAQHYHHILRRRTTLQRKPPRATHKR